jgi:SAM-dependent methyltransferase
MGVSGCTLPMLGRMPSASYTDPRLAALYDALNPPGAETAFYLGLADEVRRAGRSPALILDVGCGTGLLACQLAARGDRVTGADPAPAMLRVARSRPGGDRVRWIETDAAGLADPARFDLVIMTGHVFQLLLTDQDVSAALRALSQHLAPGGRFAFETRNPAVHEWQDWSPRRTRQRVQAAGLAADVHYDIADVCGELVTYETCFRFADDDIVIVPDTLRFMDQGQVAAFLAGAGYTGVTWYGDWDRSPAREASPEIIAVAGREAAE